MFTLKEAQQKALDRSKAGGQWMVVKKGDDFIFKPYNHSEENLFVYFAGKELKSTDS